MSTKTTILASCAIFALLGAPLATAEAATNTSAKNETSATRDLNLQQLKTPGATNVAANQNTTSSAAAKSSNTAAPKSTNTTAANKTEQASADKDQISADEMKKAVTLTKVEMPKETLASAKIDDRAGEHIGQVQDVVLDAKGNPSALHVDVGEFLGGGSHVVTINSSRLSYLPDRKLVVANLTKAQIRALPMVKEPGAAGAKSSPDSKADKGAPVP